jgi:hypothetical protein
MTKVRAADILLHDLPPTIVTCLWELQAIHSPVIVITFSAKTRVRTPSTWLCSSEFTRVWERGWQYPASECHYLVLRILK